MEKCRYHEMLPHEILERRRRFPAAFIGLGMLEWHGQHLAIGNDALKAERLCELAAMQSGGFAMPTLWYGEPLVIHNSNGEHDVENRNKNQMQWKPEKYQQSYVKLDPDEELALYKRLLHRVLLQMNLIEMRAVVLVCGHYPLIEYAAPVVESFNREIKDTRAFAGIEYQFTPQNSLKGKDAGGDHAAKWETSYLMYLRPECVDVTVYSDPAVGEPVGVYGDDPRVHASREVGRRGVELIVEGMIRKANELLAP